MPNFFNRLLERIPSIDVVARSAWQRHDVVFALEHNMPLWRRIIDFLRALRRSEPGFEHLWQGNPHYWMIVAIELARHILVMEEEIAEKEQLRQYVEGGPRKPLATYGGVEQVPLEEMVARGYWTETQYCNFRHAHPDIKWTLMVKKGGN